MDFFENLKKFDLLLSSPDFNNYIRIAEIMYDNLIDANVYGRKKLLINNDNKMCIIIPEMTLAAGITINSIDIKISGDYVVACIEYWMIFKIHLYYNENNKVIYFSISDNSSGGEAFNALITDEDVFLFNISIPRDELESTLFQISTTTNYKLDFIGKLL